MYTTWIPIGILIMIISNLIVSAVTWKCARKDIINISKRKRKITMKNTQVSVPYSVSDGIEVVPNDVRETTPLLSEI